MKSLKSWLLENRQRCDKSEIQAIEVLAAISFAYRPLCATLADLRKLIDICEDSIDDVEAGGPNPAKLKETGDALTLALDGKEKGASIFEGCFGPPTLEHDGGATGQLTLWADILGGHQSEDSNFAEKVAELVFGIDGGLRSLRRFGRVNAIKQLRGDLGELEEAMRCNHLSTELVGVYKSLFMEFATEHDELMTLREVEVLTGLAIRIKG